MRRELKQLVKENAELDCKSAIQQIKRIKEQSNKRIGKAKIELDEVINICIENLRDKVDIYFAFGGQPNVNRRLGL